MQTQDCTCNCKARFRHAGRAVCVFFKMRTFQKRATTETLTTNWTRTKIHFGFFQILMVRS